MNDMDAPDPLQAPEAFNFQDFPTIVLARSWEARATWVEPDESDIRSIPLTINQRNVAILAKDLEEATAFINLFKRTELFDDIVTRSSLRMQNLAVFLFQRKAHFCDITGLKGPDMNNLNALEDFREWQGKSSTL